MRWRRRLKPAAVAVGLLAYAGLSHYSNTSAPTRNGAIVLAVGPALAVGLALTWRGIHPLAAVAAAAAAALLLHHFWPALARNFPLVYLLQEGGFYSLLAASFGLSLRRGRVALCTRLADRLHGPLTPGELRYTRRVTWAWTLFFVLITVATLGFYLAAPLRSWSLFANFCVLPLVGLMFVAEYAVRRRVLPQVQHRGILASVRVYFADSSRAP
ncbi:MAG TPA: hypothetical protein VN692_22640 [Steroidobacteraceae bacterium]|nr:hypothetical protein [Steroidobacteraceae bacterium]